MATYPHERQVEYWVSHAIEDYFENEGYDVTVLPNNNRAEAALPYDHLFAGQGVKVFGLQYKRFHSSAQDHWLIDVAQFRQALKFDWIYYALPDIASIRQRRNALHLVRIAKSSALDRRISTATGRNHRLLPSDMGIGRGKTPYYRWGGFVQSLLACGEGWLPGNADQLRSVFRDDDLQSTLVDLYVISLDAKLAIIMTQSALDVQDIDDGLDPGPNRS